MLIKKVSCLLIFLLSFFVSAGGQAKADVQSDVNAVIKILMFRIPPQSGVVPFAVIYDKSKPETFAQAKIIESAAKQAGDKRISLSPFLIDIRAIPTINSSVAYLTNGVASKDIFNVLAAKKILTITSSSNCVVNATCVISITSEPKVKIQMNLIAAQKTGVDFQSAFRMMIQEN